MEKISGLYLFRGDLLIKYRDVDIKEITIDMFKEFKSKFFLQEDLIIFIDDDGKYKYKIIKSRYFNS